MKTTKPIPEAIRVEDAGRDPSTGIRKFRVFNTLAEVRAEIERLQAKRAELVRLAALAAMTTQGNAR
jgi:hypothetical protein